MMQLVDTLAIQDQMPDQPCWGCGPGNRQGLHLKSYWSGVGTICTWRPEPHHVGWPGVLNGGVLAALVDCHCVCTAVADSYPVEGRTPDTQPPIWFATGSLNISYLKPVPVDAPVQLNATITERTPRKTRIECVVMSSDEVCARAEVVAVRIARQLGSPA